MRTREEILADGRVVQQLILEVLLDIRDKVASGGDQAGQVPKRKPGRPPKRKEGG